MSLKRLITHTLHSPRSGHSRRYWYRSPCPPCWEGEAAVASRGITDIIPDKAFFVGLYEALELGVVGNEVDAFPLAQVPDGGIRLKLSKTMRFVSSEVNLRRVRRLTSLMNCLISSSLASACRNLSATCSIMAHGLV